MAEVTRVYRLVQEMSVEQIEGTLAIRDIKVEPDLSLKSK